MSRATTPRHRDGIGESRTHAARVTQRELPGVVQLSLSPAFLRVDRSPRGDEGIPDVGPEGPTHMIRPPHPALKRRTIIRCVAKITALWAERSWDDLDARAAYQSATRYPRQLWSSLLVTLVIVALTSCRPPHAGKIVVGSKNFTEQVILAELMAQHIEARLHVPVERRFYLAGSYIAHQAVLADRIDIYPEYTGTALTAILKESPNWDANTVFNEVHEGYESRFHLTVAPPFGFNNSFAMVMRGADARQLGISKLSQAKPFAAQWTLGCGYEFLERPDGYQGFVRRYGLTFRDKPRVMDLGLLYRALKDRQIDLAAGNGTDGVIAALDMAVLEDDLHYFPPYEAVPIVNDDALKRFPQLASALNDLANTISDDEMRKLNYSVDGEHRDVVDLVKEFRNKKGL